MVVSFRGTEKMRVPDDIRGTLVAVRARARGTTRMPRNKQESPCAYKALLTSMLASGSSPVSTSAVGLKPKMIGMQLACPLNFLRSRTPVVHWVWVFRAIPMFGSACKHTAQQTRQCWSCSLRTHLFRLPWDPNAAQKAISL